MKIPYVGIAFLTILLLMRNKVSAAALSKINVGSRTRTRINIDNKDFFTNYPLLPVVANEWTKIPVADLIKKLKSSGFDPAVAKSIYGIILNEAARDKSKKNFIGINNNYSGVQTDSGVWGYANFVGQTAKVDSGGYNRMFAVFDDLDSFLAFMESRVIAKGLDKAATPTEWSRLYLTNWVGKTPTSALIANKEAIYKSALKQYSSK